MKEKRESQKEVILPTPEIMELPVELPEIANEDKAETQEKIRELNAELIQVQEVAEIEDPKVREQKIKEYQKKYLPDHLKSKHKNILKRGLENVMGLFAPEAEGKENIPEDEPFVIIANHFGPEVGAIAKNFKDRDLHFVIGKQIWWDRSPLHQWFFKKMGMVPVEESLAHLSKEEKEASLEKQDAYGRKVFRKIIDREEEGRRPVDREFVRQSVALLSRGDVVCLFPEGLWLNPEGSATGPREKAEMKQGYEGLELIARQYQKLTGKELPILPTAFNEDKESKRSTFRIGKAVSLKENDSNLSNTDWCMAQVAEMLPESQRGYYKDKTDYLQK